MADSADYILLRSDTGMTIMTLTDVQAAAIYAQVAALYPTGSAGVIYAAARVAVLQQQLASYATQATYTQNQESESLSDIFNNLLRLLGYWQRKLDDALDDDTTGTGPQPPPSFVTRLIPSW